MSRTQAERKTASDTKRQLIQDADSRTLKRAQKEAFSFSLEAPGLIRVTNGSHANPEDHSYRVNIVDGIPVACECPAFKHHSGLCKHALGCLIRTPVMAAAQGPVMADGGTSKPYTTHVEPADQGGKEYVKCADCGWELLTDLGGWDNLPHSEDCRYE